MYTCNYGNEPMDLKLLFLKMIHKIYVPLLAAVIGAVVCGATYYLDTFVFTGEHEYTTTTKFYIDYNELEKNADEVYVYFNEYTWNNLLKNDIILGYVKEYLEGKVMTDGVTGVSIPKDYRTEEFLNGAVSCRLLSDTRILTVTVVTNDPEMSIAIASAYENAIPQFTATTKEIKDVRLFLKGDSAEQIKIDNLTWRAVVLGSVVFLVITLLMMLVEFILDDSLYFPITAEQRFGYPVFGVLFRKGQKPEKWYEEELKLNLSKLKVSEKKYVLLTEEKESQITDFPLLSGIQYDPELINEAKKYDEVILTFAYGKHNGKRLERILSLLDKQDIKVSGLILTDADSRMYRQYFWPKKSR